MGGVGARLRQEVGLARLVPQAQARRQPDGLASRVPFRVRHPDLDMATPSIEPHPRRRPADRLAVRRAEEVGDQALLRTGVHGEEQVGRCAHVGAVRERTRLPLAAADRDRERDQRGVLQRVERHAEGGGPAERPHPQLDQVGCVVRIARIGRVGVGAVRLREQVARGAGVVRIGRQVRAGVVEEEVLVEELAVAVRDGPGDEDRLRLPRRPVRELRGLGGAFVEEVGTGPRGGALVQRVPRRRGPGGNRGRGKKSGES